MKRLVIAGILALSLVLPSLAYAEIPAAPGLGGRPVAPTASTPAPTTPTSPTSPAPSSCGDYTSADAWVTAKCWQIMPDFSAGFGDWFFRQIYKILGTLGWFFYRFSIAIFAFGAWWLDGAVYYLVLKMGGFINAAAANGIRDAWMMIRDICNIMIIGGFVAVGISTILQVSQYAADKFLSRLIIAALLINFSYFFAATFIDFSNFVAQEIMVSDFMTSACGKDMDAVQKPGQSTLSYARFIVLPYEAAYGTSDTRLCSFGTSFALKTKMHTWDNIECMARKRINAPTQCKVIDGKFQAITGKNDTVTNASDLSGTNLTNFYWELFIMTVFAGIFILSAAFVFIGMAYMLIARFVILIMVLITSPIGIAATNIPYIERYAGRWWDMLISQAIFAPVFFVLIAISFRVIEGFITFYQVGDVGYMNATGGSAAAGSMIDGNLSLYLTFFVSIAFMLLSLYVAKMIASSVGEFKGVYDFASKAAMGTFKAPLMPLLRIPAGALGYGTEYLAKGTKEGGWGRWGLANLSGALRYAGRFQDGKKHEKSPFESAHEDIQAGGRARGNEKERRQIEGGLFDMHTGDPMRGLIWGKNGDRTDEDRKRSRDFYDNEDPDEVRARLGEEKFNELAGQKMFSDDFLKKVNSSKNMSSADKKKFNQSYFEGLGFVKNKDGKYDAKAAEAFEDMTDVERQILLAERGELRADKEFLSLLKSDTYDGVMKGGSQKEQADGKTMRQEGLHAQINREGATDKERRDILTRMSPKERARMDPATAAKVLHLMSPAEIRHLHANGSPEIQAAIEAHPTAKKHIKGTYIGDE